MANNVRPRLTTRIANGYDSHTIDPPHTIRIRSDDQFDTDDKDVDFPYATYRSRGIEPFATLDHFSFFFSHLFAERASPFLFAAYFNTSLLYLQAAVFCDSKNINIILLK